jgi:hypothetical protein
MGVDGKPLLAGAASKVHMPDLPMAFWTID